MQRFTSIYIHTTHFGSHTEITLQVIPNQAYTLRLSVENVEREVERKNNHTWRPVAQLGPDHNLLAVRPGNVAVRRLMVVEVAHVRSRSESSVGSPLRRPGSSSACHRCRTPSVAWCHCCTTSSFPFPLFISSSLLLLPPHFSPILYVVLLCLTHALFSMQGKSDWDWGSCPPSPQEFHDL